MFLQDPAEGVALLLCEAAREDDFELDVEVALLLWILLVRHALAAYNFLVARADDLVYGHAEAPLVQCQHLNRSAAESLLEGHARRVDQIVALALEAVMRLGNGQRLRLVEDVHDRTLHMRDGVGEREKKVKIR